jgi:hypothetical protein
MSTLVTTAAMAMAVVAAARSTWSPCGVSMLATVTPLAERARGHRYRSTASWFVAGAVAGGACLGLAAALLALGVRAAGPGTPVVAALALAASLLAAASDARVCGFSLPVHHRQVNERWLDGFRPWVYGAGFGWQIGCGLATYIKTAAVYLTVVLAALTADPWVALGVGVLFGFVRGLAVLLGRPISSPAALAAFHQRFAAWEPRALALTVAAEVAAAGAFAVALSPWAAVAAVVPAIVVAGARSYPRRSTALIRTGSSRTS